MKILKYKLEGDKVTVPAGFQPLHVRFQESQYGDGIHLWGLVDPAVTEEKTYSFSIIPTGLDIKKETLENEAYFGTVEAGDLILHVTLEQRMFIPGE